MPTKPIKIKHPYFVLCEAAADANTFSALIKQNNLPDIFQFEYPDDEKYGFGKDAFWSKLSPLALWADIEDLKGIILLRDTDDKPDTALRELKQQLRKANKEQGDFPDIFFAEPNDFLTPSVGGTYPILFASVPFSKPGCLETLILPAVEKAFSEHKNCLDKYEACCNINDWPLAKQHKMRLACLVATICEKDPTCSVSNMWYKEEFKKLLTDKESFGEIIDFFKNIEQTMAPKQKHEKDFVSPNSISDDCLLQED